MPSDQATGAEEPADRAENTGRVSGTDVTNLPLPADTETALAAVVALRRAADRLELGAVQCAIDKGWTWAEIAESLGVTRQAVHKRYAKRLNPKSSNKEQQ